MQPRHEPPWRDRLGASNQLQRFQHGCRLERRPSGQKLIKYCSQRINVGRRTCLLCFSACLFRRHVTRGTKDLLAPRQAGVDPHRLGQSEVGDLGGAVGGEQDIGRLEIAMHDPQHMRGVHRPSQCLDQRDCVPGRLGRAIELVSQATPLDEFELEIRKPV